MLKKFFITLVLGGIFGNPAIAHAQKVVEKKDEKEIAVDKQTRCLAEVIYYEIRSGGLKARITVAQTVLHRVGNPEFGNSVCEIINRKDFRKGKWRYQYSWAHHPPARRETHDWILALLVASSLMDPECAIVDYASKVTPNGTLVGTYFNDSSAHVKLDNNLVQIASIDGMDIFAPKNPEK